MKKGNLLEKKRNGKELKKQWMEREREREKESEREETMGLSAE